MIQQLVRRLVGQGLTQEKAAQWVLAADPSDLAMAVEQVWREAGLWGEATSVPPQTKPGLVDFLTTHGAFGEALDKTRPPAGFPAWDHLIYAFAVENTRANQIVRRVVHAYRTGEKLGIPTVSTQRWLDATESLLFGPTGYLQPALATSEIQPDHERSRRGDYYRMFGMDLAFGTEENAPFTYDKAVSANTSFVKLFEELLYEVWQAMTNVRNLAGVNQSDDDRIYRLAEQLTFILRARRQNQLLAREELVAVTQMGWLELSLSTNTPVVEDLKAQATSAADRLRLIGERVGLAAHSRAGSLLAMASDLSLILRTIEANYVTGPQFAWLFYADTPPSPLPAGATLLTPHTRRVITEWSAATGRDLKQRGTDVRVVPVGS